MEKLKIRTLRITGLAEGISFILLLGIAMPLKYFFHLPLAVKVVGWIRGMLFMAYLLIVLLSIRIMKWSRTETLVALAASLIPAGTFWLDRSWKIREREMEQIRNS